MLNKNPKLSLANRKQLNYWLNKQKDKTMSKCKLKPTRIRTLKLQSNHKKYHSKNKLIEQHIKLKSQLK